jgi:hypothetical protein
MQLAIDNYAKTVTALDVRDLWEPQGHSAAGRRSRPN